MRLLAMILTPLLQLINNRIPLLGRFGQPVHTRITRARNRLFRLLTLLAAGRFPAPRAATPPAGTPDAIKRPGGPRPPYLPRRRAWLVHIIGYQAAGFGSQLQHWLDSPQTQAILAAAPPHAIASATRTLRPLCRLLGVTLPTILHTAPRPPPIKPPRAKPTRPPRPKPVPIPAHLPIYPQRRPRPMPFLTAPRKIALT